MKKKLECSRMIDWNVGGTSPPVFGNCIIATSSQFLAPLLIEIDAAYLI
jgi:hypothetical protein